MSTPPPSRDDDSLAQIDLRAILDWLATPPAARPEDELAPLHTHLTALRDARTTAHRRHEVLDMLYVRAHAAISRLLPELIDVSLPLSRRTRHTVRGMQELLLAIAEDYVDTLGDLDERLVKGLRRPPELTLWRTIDALASHLLISSHVAAPFAAGIWLRLHRAYALACQDGLALSPVHGTDRTVQTAYLNALLLACAQPASFTSAEIELVIDYIARFGSRATVLAETDDAEAEGVFWIDPERDAPPTAVIRRPAPPGALRFSCERLAELAEEQLDAIERGVPADALDLPEEANTPMGHGVLRRLAHYWGHPGKRRFPRRRQNYRAVLCIGLQSMWKLFRDDATEAGELTSWMVTNESPDGYALMHVSGKTARIAAGDVVAIRTETATTWQVCIVRWALSENPEHLELGLQILATKATPAILAEHAGGDRSAETAQQQVLLLPRLPPVRPTETLLAPSGTAHPGLGRMVLLLERDNLEVREVHATRLDEQTGRVEILAIEPEKSV